MFDYYGVTSVKYRDFEEQEDISVYSDRNYVLEEEVPRRILIETEDELRILLNPVQKQG